MQVRNSWDLPVSVPGDGLDIPDGEVRERCADLFLDAVQIRLRADVRV